MKISDINMIEQEIDTPSTDEIKSALIRRKAKIAGTFKSMGKSIDVIISGIMNNLRSLSLWLWLRRVFSQSFLTMDHHQFAKNCLSQAKITEGFCATCKKDNLPIDPEYEVCVECTEIERQLSNGIQDKHWTKAAKCPVHGLVPFIRCGDIIPFCAGCFLQKGVRNEAEIEKNQRSAEFEAQTKIMKGFCLTCRKDNVPLDPKRNGVCVECTEIERQLSDGIQDNHMTKMANCPFHGIVPLIRCGNTPLCSGCYCQMTVHNKWDYLPREPLSKRQFRC